METCEGFWGPNLGKDKCRCFHDTFRMIVTLGAGGGVITKTALRSKDYLPSPWQKRMRQKERNALVNSSDG